MSAVGLAPASSEPRLLEPPAPLEPTHAATASERLRNTAGRMAVAVAARAAGEDAQVLGFTPRDFVIFGLPYKNRQMARTHLARHRTSAANASCFSAIKLDTKQRNS